MNSREFIGFLKEPDNDKINEFSEYMKMCDDLVPAGVCWLDLFRKYLNAHLLNVHVLANFLKNLMPVYIKIGDIRHSYQTYLMDVMTGYKPPDRDMLGIINILEKRNILKHLLDDYKSRMMDRDPYSSFLFRLPEPFTIMIGEDQKSGVKFTDKQIDMFFSIIPDVELAFRVIDLRGCKDFKKLEYRFGVLKYNIDLCQFIVNNPHIPYNLKLVVAGANKWSSLYTHYGQNTENVFRFVKLLRGWGIPDNVISSTPAAKKIAEINMEKVNET